MKLKGIIGVLAFCAAVSAAACFAADSANSSQDTPVTPNASLEVQSLFAYFQSIYGKKILSGQQEGHRDEGGSFEFNYIGQVTGKIPAVRSYDLNQYTPPTDDSARLTVTQKARDWYLRSNGIVAICWHWRTPMGGEEIYAKDTSFDLRRAVTEGTPEYAAALRDLDTIAGQLKELRDAHVPVLWRPLHEANGRWFWWGAQGPEPFKQMWRLMFDRFVHYHKLNNLIWIFSPGAAVDLADWYPGDAYVDIIGQDSYPMDKNTGPVKDVFEQLVNFCHGEKLLALSENGPIPDPEALVSTKAGWLFFVTWSGGSLTQLNNQQHLKAVFNHPYVANLTNLPDLKHYPFAKIGPAARLGFVSPPGDFAIAGTTRRPVTVAIEDKQGRIVRSGEFAIKLTIGTNPGGSQLAGTLMVSSVNGLASFQDLRLDKPGSGYTLIASKKGVMAAISPPFRVGPGSGILREWWTDVPGGKMSDLTSHLAATWKPAGSEVLSTAFEVPYHVCTNYGERIRGCILPPATGAYVFEIVNDGPSELWLGLDDTPESKTKVAEITGRTPYSKWPHSHEAWSAPLKLEAGKHYYIEALHTLRSGGTPLWVSWRLPDGSFQTPIPAANLSCPGAERTALASGEQKFPAIHPGNDPP